MDFCNELHRFPSPSQARYMKDFRKIPIDKINNYIGQSFLKNCLYGYIINTNDLEIKKEWHVYIESN